MGSRGILYQLRQMRSGLSNGSLVRERAIGRGDGEAAAVSSLPEPYARGTRMSRKKLATVWLDGCSGCHMSFLDMDEGLIELASLVDLVYSPLVDTKEFPPDVDITLV